MLDLDQQIRSYFDEAADPVTIEDAFFADAGDDKVRPVDKYRPTKRFDRRGLLAAAAAFVVVVVVGAVTVLVDGPPTPTTLPPVTTAPPTTVTTTTTEPATPTTTTIPVFFVPDGDVLAIDERLEAVLADLLVAADDLGWTAPITLDASLEPSEPSPGEQQYVLATFSSRPSSVLDDGPGDQFLFDTATVRAFPTVEEAVGVTEVLMEELLQGIPRVVTERTPLDLIDAGEESAASYFTLGDSIIVDLVIRDGTWVVSMNLLKEGVFLDGFGAGEAPAELRTLIDAILGSRGRGADLGVSKARPAVPAEAPETYEHSWVISASAPDFRPEDPESPEANPVFVERSYALAVLAAGERCRFLETPFGAIEPQDYTEFFDDGSGVVSLSRTGMANGEPLDENAELAGDDPRYLTARAACMRFEPLVDVRDLILGAAPERPSDAFEQAVRGDAYQTGEDAWVIVDSTDERSFVLDPSLLVALGITQEVAPEGVEIIEWTASVHGNRFLSFVAQARGTRAALEVAFDVDLSAMPDRVLEFSFGYEFHLEPDDPNQR